MFRAALLFRLICFKMPELVRSTWRALWRHRTQLFACCLLMTVISLLYTLHTYSGFSLILDTAHNAVSWQLDSSCSGRSNIAFLKSHKCASSAIQNILFRYGEKHGLHMAIPDYGNYYGSGANFFMAAMVKSAPWSKLGINIFAIHTKWNYPEIVKIMPKDTIYLTIVREPTQLFESLYVYTNMDKYYSMTVEEFAMTMPATVPRYRGFLGFNQMASDLGMAPADIHNITKVANRLKAASEEFGLVLVAERMEESLVLLAHRLCWDLEDVMVLKLNARRKEHKSKLSKDAQKALRDKLNPDYLIYRHFVNRLDALVQDFGQERMERELVRFRKLTQELHTACGFQEKPSINMKGVNKPWSPMVDGYSANTTNTTCSLFSISEHAFIQRIRDKQRKEYIKRYGFLSKPQNAVPFGGIPLGGIPLGGSPLGGIPLDGSPEHTESRSDNQHPSNAISLDMAEALRKLSLNGISPQEALRKISLKKNISPQELPKILMNMAENGIETVTFPKISPSYPQMVSVHSNFSELIGMTESIAGLDKL